MNSKLIIATVVAIALLIINLIIGLKNTNQISNVKAELTEVRTVRQKVQINVAQGAPPKDTVITNDLNETVNYLLNQDQAIIRAILRVHPELNQPAQ